MATNIEKLEHILLIAPSDRASQLWAKEYSKKQRFHANYDADICYNYRISGLNAPTQGPSGGYSMPAPPYRAPHSSTSLPGLTGRVIKGWRHHPGELSLAHGGTLFFHEADFIAKRTLDRILEVVASGSLRLSSNLTVPVDLTLVAAVKKDSKRLDELKKLCRVICLDNDGNDTAEKYLRKV